MIILCESFSLRTRSLSPILEQKILRVSRAHSAERGWSLNDALEGEMQRNASYLLLTVNGCIRAPSNISSVWDLPGPTHPTLLFIKAFGISAKEHK